MTATTGWHVREATLDDTEWLVRGSLSLAQESEGVALDPHAVRNGVHSALAEGHATYLLACGPTTGEPVGQLMLTREWSDWRNGWFWWIQSVWVSHTHRREGVYRSLHDAVLERAQHRGDVCGVRLYVALDNHGAIATYQALGMAKAHYHIMELDFSGIRHGIQEVAGD